jgi:hypothetical protein
MTRFNRRSWMLSIRANELSDIDPVLLPSALALQAAVIADGLTDQTGWEDHGAPRRRALRRSARLARPRPVPRSAGPRPRAAILGDARNPARS